MEFYKGMSIPGLVSGYIFEGNLPFYNGKNDSGITIEMDGGVRGFNIRATAIFDGEKWKVSGSSFDFTGEKVYICEKVRTLVYEKEKE